MKKITEWIDDLKMKSSDTLLPKKQNEFICSLNGFSEFPNMSKPMRTEIIRRALELSQGLKGVLTALITISELGNACENPKGKPELFGVYPDDYRLFGDLYDKINSEMR